MTEPNWRQFVWVGFDRNGRMTTILNSPHPPYADWTTHAAELVPLSPDQEAKMRRRYEERLARIDAWTPKPRAVPPNLPDAEWAGAGQRRPPCPDGTIDL